MSLNIVGISAFFHDSACCVMRDGHLVCAAEEERFSRCKHDPGLPWRAFRFCLEDAGLTLADIDCVAYYEQPLQKLERQIWMGLNPQASPQLKAELGGALDPRRVERAIRHGLGYEGPLEFAGHHLSHAASSYYYSGFEEAAILTVDAVGEWATTSYGHGHGQTIDMLGEVCFPHSLGMLYSAITAYLGFEVNSGEYKVMGLAPYGQPHYTDQIRALIALDSDGGYRLDMRYFDYLSGGAMFTASMAELFGRPARQPEGTIDAFHQDVARSLQAVLEDILLQKVAWLHQRVPSQNLCMAGGVALNCVANSRILRDGPFQRLFVQPAAGDSGGAFGAAAVAHVRLTEQRPAGGRLQHVYLGPSFAPGDVRRLLAAGAAAARDFTGNEAAMIDAVVERLIAGMVIGWFHGRMEFGPRALGARSILADPRRPDMRERINALVKKREAFRPFAPAVLEEEAARHFALDHPSPFMLETCRVESPLDLPAVTHVDRSARVQTVSRDTNPRFHRLISRFFERTGTPLLLNTSFNMRDEPIVCTPVDAIRCFVRSSIDTLVLEDWLIDRSAIPPLWELAAAGGPSASTNAIRHDVYTLF